MKEEIIKYTSGNNYYNIAPAVVPVIGALSSVIGVSHTIYRNNHESKQAEAYQQMTGDKKKVYVNKSSIHGKGLFSKKDIPNGDAILTVFENGNMNGWAKFINHSNVPNSFPEMAGNKVILKASRNINKRSEITVDYGKWNKILPVKYNTRDFRINARDEKERVIRGIAYVITHRKPELAAVLAKASLLPVGGWDDVMIADIIIDNLHNEIVNNGILNLLPSDTFTHSNIEPFTIMAIIGLATALVKGASGVQQSVSKRKLLTRQEKEAAKQRLREAIAEQNKKIEQRKKENTYWIIGIAGFTVLSLGTAAVIYYKNKKA